MTTSDKPSFQMAFDPCYVYIFATGKMKFTIGMAGNPPIEPFQRFDQLGCNAAIRLVYYRRFDDTLTALGFKRLIEVLDPASVEYLIRRSNPGLETLVFQRSESSM